MFTTDIKYLYVIFHIELNIRWRVGMAPENHGHGWGSAPYGQSDSISRRWAASKPDSWKDEARPRARSLFPLATLWCSWTRRAQTRARLTWKPARWTLPTKPTIGGGLRPCQSRNGATKSTIAEESFPGDVTQPSQVSTREQPKEPELNTWRPKQRTPAGKRTNSEPALYQSKQVQTEFLILTELVKIWCECSNKTYVFVRDLFAGWLSYEIGKNVIL